MQCFSSMINSSVRRAWKTQVLPRDSDPRRRCLAQLWIHLEPRSSDTVWCKEFEVLFYFFLSWHGRDICYLKRERDIYNIYTRVYIYTGNSGLTSTFTMVWSQQMAEEPPIFKLVPLCCLQLMAIASWSFISPWLSKPVISCLVENFKMLQTYTYIYIIFIPCLEWLSPVHKHI